MKMLTNITNKLYSWITLIALSIGLIVALMFLISLVIGGQNGENLAIAAADLMTWAIRLATLTVLAGLINIYVSKRHTLTMEKDSIEEITEEEGVEVRKNAR